MPLSIKNKYKVRKDKLELWLRVATDVRAGMSAPEIAKRYKNPKTKKHYHTQWVWYVIKRLNELEARKEITL